MEWMILWTTLSRKIASFASDPPLAAADWVRDVECNIGLARPARLLMPECWQHPAKDEPSGWSDGWY